jgi:hypothetical protein
MAAILLEKGPTVMDCGVSFALRLLLSPLRGLWVFVDAFPGFHPGLFSCAPYGSLIPCPSKLERGAGARCVRRGFETKGRRSQPGTGGDG